MKKVLYFATVNLKNIDHTIYIDATGYASASTEKFAKAFTTPEAAIERARKQYGDRTDFIRAGAWAIFEEDLNLRSYL